MQTRVAGLIRNNNVFLPWLNELACAFFDGCAEWTSPDNNVTNTFLKFAVKTLKIYTSLFPTVPYRRSPSVLTVPDQEINAALSCVCVCALEIVPRDIANKKSRTCVFVCLFDVLLWASGLLLLVFKLTSEKWRRRMWILMVRHCTCKLQWPLNCSGIPTWMRNRHRFDQETVNSKKISRWSCFQVVS